jgi:hypothetical protein
MRSLANKIILLDRNTVSLILSGNKFLNLIKPDSLTRAQNMLVYGEVSEV